MAVQRKNIEDVRIGGDAKGAGMRRGEEKMRGCKSERERKPGDNGVKGEERHREEEGALMNNPLAKIKKKR